MKLIIQILLLVILPVNCFSQQTHSLKINLAEKNNIKCKIDTISSAEFKKKGKPIHWTEPKVNPKIDSIFIALAERYPDAFGNKPLCIFLNSVEEQVEICNDSISEKEWWRYTIDDYQNGFLYFHEIGYASDSYTLFNPENRLLKSVNSYPNFIGTKGIYVVSSAEGNFSFAYQSMVNDNYFGFSCEGWISTNYYKIKNEFYFEFVPNDKKEAKKYVRVTLLN